MSIFKYSDSSPVNEITLRKTAGGGSRAFLFARDDISADQAEKIKATLNNAHLSCVASEKDGRHCLEVRGCKNVSVIESVLGAAGLLKGHTQEDRSDNEKFSLKDKIRNNLVSIYGMLNLAADVGYYQYGKMKKDLGDGSVWEDQAAAVAYAAGSSNFFLFGRGDKSDHQARDIALNIQKEFHDRGLELSSDSAAMAFSVISHRQGMARKANNYLAKHGAEAGNVATAMAGAFVAKGALKSDKTSTKIMDGVLGATTFASGIGAAVVKEKAPDPNNRPTTTWGKVKEWVHERPNRLAGYGYMVSTALHAVQTVFHYNGAEEKYKKDIAKVKLAHKAYSYRGAFIVLNLIGEFVLAAASKGHGSGVKGNESIEETALSLVADAIVRQPQAKRDELIRDMGQKFLTNPDVLGGDGAELEAKLYQRVHKLESSPWLGGAKPQAAAPQEQLAAVASEVQTTPETQKSWAEGKVQKLVADNVRAKPESHVAAVLDGNSKSLSHSL